MNGNSYILALIAMVLIVILVYLTRYNINQNYAQSESYTPNLNSNLNLEDKNVKIVTYYAPWCGMSVRFMPEWNKIVDHVNQNYKNVKTELINCEENEDNNKICIAEKIIGYPTIKVFEGGNSKDFVGARNAESILKFALE